MAENNKEPEYKLTDEPDKLPERFTYGKGDIIIKMPKDKA